MYQPDSNKVLRTQQYYLDQMVCSLAGRAAEDIFYDGVTSDGAGDDMRKTTNMAHLSVTTVGFSDKMPNMNYRDAELGLNGERYKVAESIKEIIDSEMQRITAECYKKAYD